MSTGIAVAAAAIALIALLTHPNVSRIVKEWLRQRREQEIKETRRRMNEALENGYPGLAAYHRRRLHDLLKECD